jgi:hypothetical protein
MAAGYTCPICDYPNLSEPPRSEFGGGSFEICPSCGFQFGVNDDDEGISYETWRRRWEAAGMPWSSLALKEPASWKPVAQHVAPGGAALRRPGEAADPVPAKEKAPAPAATAKPRGASPKASAPKPVVKKPSAPAKKAPKPAAKNTPAQKSPAKKAPAKKALAKKSSRR